MSRVPTNIHDQVRENARRAQSLHQALERNAYEQQVEGVRLRLEAAGNRYIAAADAMGQIVAERDEAIIEASRHRLPRRYVALATGLTPGRIQQILDAAGQPEARLYLCTTCGRNMRTIDPNCLPPCPKCGGREWLLGRS